MVPMILGERAAETPRPPACEHALFHVLQSLTCRLDSLFVLAQRPIRPLTGHDLGADAPATDCCRLATAGQGGEAVAEQLRSPAQPAPYPCGLADCQRQVSAIISGRPRCACQPSSRVARVGSA